ncbi:putative acyl-CoA oxidase [Tieghemostelium lacteum]|uniref:Acyl-coenzyme A oxidase n=1 Tax=Tieghemostelium lacteum TaxID=361077 RepID=A0A152A546_TIELA|nr:putative acyl-CoA oxidase [Tieghemostelium lacteum]|eukprot:KYR01185.1 putative acyl-CoA oxidase [Tieghemostelium lacteum]
MDRIEILSNHFNNELISNPTLATNQNNNQNNNNQINNNIVTTNILNNLEQKKLTNKDLEYLTDLLIGHPDELLRSQREKIVEALKDPIFQPQLYASIPEQRELAQKRLLKISEAQCLKLSEVISNYKRFSMFHGLLVYSDMSLAVKSAVHWGLFGASIVCLGSEQHRKYYDAIDNCEIRGCFALTELGHGSNVRGVETIAEYDPEQRQFVIHTPSDTAQKIWIGNAAIYATYATVFANLHLNGQDYGLHPFMVPLRDPKTMQLLPGITAADNGPKIGLNGVDNGRLWFKQVRIPKENILNKFGDVSDDGTYSTPIKNPNVRFNSMLEALIGGRVSVSNMANSCSKMGLSIAVHYACTRRQFGPSGQKEQLLMEYPSHQRRLIPLIASAYAYQISINYITSKFQNKTEKDARDVFMLACGFKAAVTWNRVKTLQTCREACGGMGLAASNRIGLLRADSDVDLTYEGDNTVLMQAVAKALLVEFRSYFTGSKRITGMLSYTYSKGHIGIFLRNKNFFTKRLSSETHLMDADMLLDAFIYREFKLLRILIKSLRDKMKSDKMTSLQAWNHCSDLIQQLSLAYVERVTIEKFLEEIQQSPPSTKPILTSLCILYELTKIEEDMGWFLSNKYFAPVKAQAIRNAINKVCYSLRDHALPLVKAFDIPSQFINTPIQGDWVSHFSNPNNY